MCICASCFVYVLYLLAYICVCCMCFPQQQIVELENELNARTELADENDRYLQLS